MQEIVDKFNSLFEGDARAEIKNNDLKITVGSQTLIIQLPSVVGENVCGDKI